MRPRYPRVNRRAIIRRGLRPLTGIANAPSVGQEGIGPRTAPPAPPPDKPTQSSTQGPSTFGDSYYHGSVSGLGGLYPSLQQGIGGQNARDESYLIQMGYTPQQAQAAIQSNNTKIADPNDPAKTVDYNIGQLTPGALDWNQVDVSNPYSRAGMLVKSYRGAVQGTSTGMAAGGHGRSGAALTAQQGNSYNFGSGQNQWNQDLQGYVTGSQEARTGLVGGYSQGVLGAVQDFIGRQKDAPTVTSPQGAVTSLPATGSFILGNQAGNGLPSYDQWVAEYFPGEDKPQLANGWSVEIKDGKIVRFIPPGGK